ncbi:MAG: HupE/UreJ family protein [Vicinamibacterales bacterium]
MPRSHQFRSHLWMGCGIVVALVLAFAPAPRAHEIPSEVTVWAFLKPEGERLTLLVRAPLESMRDVDIPLRDRGYVNLADVDRSLRDAAMLWIGDFVQVYEGDTKLAKPGVAGVRVSLPSDRSFASYEQALAHIEGPPLPENTDLYWEQGLIDVAFVYPIQSDQSPFAISPGLTRLGVRVNVALHFLPPSGVERVFDVHGDPGIVRLDPRWHQAALRFVEEGFAHILDGIDHLLFLLCLIIPFRRLRPLVLIVTSFTVAHSVTLIASAYDMAPRALWFPPLIETLIAVSILYMAFENIVGAKIQRRWIITFAFGLIHGFGFSFALRETLQFAGAHVLTSLLAFNVGVELGQALVLGIAVSLLNLLFRYVVVERTGSILLSALVAHTAWHWASERGSQLAQYPWPALDLAMLAAGMRLAMIVLIAAGLVWLVAALLGKPTATRDAH